jgi:hippurate hydrolase
MGAAALDDAKRLNMGGEDFPLFVTEPYIPSVYYKIGATPPEKIKASREGKLQIPGNHSPLFRVDAPAAVKTGVESATIALLELLKK